MAIARGERPELSLPENEFSERIRACVESCWKEDPKQRPSMQEVQLTLESILSDRSEKDKNSCLLVKASKTDQQSFNGQRESIGMQPSANVEPIELTTNRKHIDLPPLAQATVRFDHGMMSPISPGLGFPDFTVPASTNLGLSANDTAHIHFPVEKERPAPISHLPTPPETPTLISGLSPLSFPSPDDRPTLPVSVSILSCIRLFCLHPQRDIHCLLLQVICRFYRRHLAYGPTVQNWLSWKNHLLVNRLPPLPHIRR